MCGIIVSSTSIVQFLYFHKNKRVGCRQVNEESLIEFWHSIWWIARTKNVHRFLNSKSSIRLILRVVKKFRHDDVRVLFSLPHGASIVQWIFSSVVRKSPNDRHFSFEWVKGQRIFRNLHSTHRKCLERLKTDSDDESLCLNDDECA